MAIALSSEIDDRWGFGVKCIAEKIRTDVRTSLSIINIILIYCRPRDIVLFARVRMSVFVCLCVCVCLCVFTQLVNYGNAVF